MESGDLENLAPKILLIYRPLWLKTNKLIGNDKIVSLQDIYNVWNASPFGVKSGLAPLLLFAYIFGKKTALLFTEMGCLFQL